MRKPPEMYVASGMQNMVQIRARNVCFTTLHIFDFFRNFSFGALGVESPHRGAMLRIVEIVRSIVGNTRS